MTVTIKVPRIHLSELGVNRAEIGDARFVAPSGHQVIVQGLDTEHVHTLAAHLFEDVELEITVRPLKAAEPRP